MKPALRVVLLQTILCIAWAAPAPALAAEPQNVIRYQIGALLPTSDETIPMIADKAVGDVDLKVQSAVAVGVAYERRFSDIFGLEFGIKYSKPKFKAEMTETPAKQPVGSVEASTRVMPLTVAALFHPLKDRSGKVDLFLGPEGWSGHRTHPGPQVPVVAAPDRPRPPRRRAAPSAARSAEPSARLRR